MSSVQHPALRVTAGLSPVEVWLSVGLPMRSRSSALCLQNSSNCRIFVICQKNGTWDNSGVLRRAVRDVGHSHEIWAISCIHMVSGYPKLGFSGVSGS